MQYIVPDCLFRTHTQFSISSRLHFIVDSLPKVEWRGEESFGYRDRD